MKPGESHSYYTDEEEIPTNKLHLKNPKQCEVEKPNDKEFIDNHSDDLSLDSINEKSDSIKSSNDLAKQDDSHTLEN